MASLTFILSQTIWIFQTRSIIFRIFLILVIFHCSSLHADRVVLKTGEIIEGDIVVDSTESIMIRTVSGSRYIEMAQVESFHKDSPEDRKKREITELVDKELKLASNQIQNKQWHQAKESLKVATSRAKELVGDNPIHDEILRLDQQIESILDENEVVLIEGVLISRDEYASRLTDGYLFSRDQRWTHASCKVCSMQGEIPCGACHGEGVLKVVCPQCEKGFIRCPTCEGRGGIACEACQGEGLVTCQVCKGSFKTPCQPCNGLGEVKRGCDTCGRGRRTIKGSGKVTRRVRSVDNWGNAVWTTIEEICPKCVGSGWLNLRCEPCKATGLLDCSKCRATGQVSCKSCNKTGHKACYHCRGAKGRRCPACSASGLKNIPCLECGSKGTKPCVSCSGKGYTGEAEPAKIIAPDTLKIPA